MDNRLTDLSHPAVAAPVSYTHLDIGKIKLRIDTVAHHIHRQRHNINVSGALSVSEKSEMCIRDRCKSIRSCSFPFAL